KQKQGFQKEIVAKLPSLATRHPLPAEMNVEDYTNPSAFLTYFEGKWTKKYIEVDFIIEDTDYGQEDSAEEAGKSNAHDCRVAPVLNLSSRERDPASIRMCRCSRRRSSHVQRCHTLLQDNYITKRVAF
ncbi:hypothetical protein BHM03_00035123, partial [Ensete ventricosum]